MGYLIIIGITVVVAMIIVFKLRSMHRYIILEEKNENGIDKWFVKVRRGFSYYYLEQIKDAPGYENDIFNTSRHQVGEQDTEVLAEKLLYNHRLTTIDGIQREGE